MAERAAGQRDGGDESGGGGPVYITTPIYYVNDKPHIGHVYTTTVCDVYARFMRMAGREVFFLTGTDEHGQKVEKSAAARGVTPQALADENSAAFREVMQGYGLSFDDFIRTTDAAHMQQVQAFVERLKETGAVYLGEFEGWYDEGQEEYYTETKAKDLGYTSPISGKPLARAKEKNYYFKLSAYQERLERLFAERPGFVRPEARKNEVLGRLREGLQDVPVSRTNFTWGVPMPGDPEHVIYVWIDALFNYVTALGLGNAGTSTRQNANIGGRKKYWPATYHVMGKEILWFHAVIWPAMLMALGLELPGCVYAHSFWIREGQKMSKSLGNFVDKAVLDSYVQRYGLDALRYYLCTQGPLGATDANFSDAHFHEVYTTDLVNTVGNCASRVTAMIGKYFEGRVPEEKGQQSAVSGQSEAQGEGRDGATQASSLKSQAAQHVAAARDAYGELELGEAIGEGIALLRKVDGFINATEPFKVAKAAASDPRKMEELQSILYQCVEAVRVASLILAPVLPGKMRELWGALGEEIAETPTRQHANMQEGGDAFAELARWGGMKAGTMVTKVALFPRVEVEKDQGQEVAKSK